MTAVVITFVVLMALGMPVAFVMGSYFNFPGSDFPTIQPVAAGACFRQVDV